MIKLVTCVVLKNLSTIYTKNCSESKDCNFKRGVKRYYKKKIIYQFNKKNIVEKN